MRADSSNADSRLLRLSRVGELAFGALRGRYWQTTVRCFATGGFDDAQARARARRAWRQAYNDLDQYDDRQTFPEWVVSRLNPASSARHRTAKTLSSAAVRDLIRTAQAGKQAFEKLWARQLPVVTKELRLESDTRESGLLESTRIQVRLKLSSCDPDVQPLAEWLRECCREVLTITRAAAGDEAAFARLIRACETRITGFFLARAVPVHDVEDLIQQTRIAGWQKLTTYCPVESIFYAWLRECIMRYVLLHYRSRRTETCLSDLQRKSDETEADVVESLPGNRGSSPPQHSSDPGLFTALMKVTWSQGGYPWQLLVFGFLKLLQWPPRLIAERLSTRRLGDLGRRLEQDYASCFPFPTAIVADGFEPLREQLARKVGGRNGVISAVDEASRQQLAGILNRRVADTELQDYYQGVPEANVSDWVYKVTQKVRRAVLSSRSPELVELARAHLAAKTVGSNRPRDSEGS